MDASRLAPIGLGTSGNDDALQCKETVRTAVELGYRHVDTAQMYDNEGAVAAGLEAADVDRSEVALATKVHPNNLAYDDVHRTTDQSLDRLGVDTVDLQYVHWPIRTYDPEETLQAFDELYEANKTRAVGLSNFTPELLEDALDRLAAPVIAHQVECHPLLPQEQLRTLAEEHGHALVAYSPLGQTELFDHPVIESVAEEQELTPAQVCLAWLLAKDTVVPIPKATGRTHLEENLAAVDLELPQAAHDRLDGIDERRRLLDPDDAAWNQQ